MFESIIQFFCQQSHLWFFQQAKMVAADLTQIHSACYDPPPDRIRIVQDACRFFFDPEQSDLPAVGMNIICACRFGAGLAHVAQRPRQHLQFKPLL